MSGGDFGTDEPTIRPEQWVERHGGGITKRKDQPTGDRGESGGVSRSEMRATAADLEVEDYQGRPVAEVIAEARTPIETRQRPVELGRKPVTVPTTPVEVSVPVVDAVSPASAAPNPWEGLGSPNRSVPETGGRAMRPGSQNVKHFR